MEFNYYCPNNLDQLFEDMKQDDQYALIAGGTDLMVKMKRKLCQPKNVIDLKNLQELKGIEALDGQIRIGAMATHTELENSSLIQDKADIVSEAARYVGSTQIRNIATVGGNIGNASPAADTVPPLLVLNGQAILCSEEGNEQVPLVDLFAGPGKLNLKKGQIIQSILIDCVKENEGTAFMKFGKRKALAISVINGAVWIKLDGNKIVQARIAFGSMAATPIRMKEVEGFLVGQEVSDAVFEKAAQLAMDQLKPIDDIRSSAEYRKNIAGTIIKKGFAVAANKARGV